MAKNYVQAGTNLTVTAQSTVNSGALVVVGDAFGVALHDAANAEELTIRCGGVWTLPKASADDPAQGARAYWTGTELTTTEDTNTPVGVFAEAAAGGTTQARVRLNDAF